MTIDDIIKELQDLRKDVDKADAALFLRAHEIEKQHAALWGQVCATFDLFLEKYFICDAVRYREFISARADRTIAAAIPAMGVASAIQAGKISDLGRRTKFIEAAVTRAKEVGVPWSDQQAKVERLKIGGSAPRDSKWNKVAGNVDDLKQQVVTLKRRVQELELENKVLQEENATLQAKLKNGSQESRRPKARTAARR